MPLSSTRPAERRNSLRAYADRELVDAIVSAEMARWRNTRVAASVSTPT